MENPPPLCLKAGKCLDAAGDKMRHCPNERDSRRYNDTVPLVPAEALCLTGLQAVRESRNKSVVVDNFASICYDLDRAIALPRIPADDFKRDLLRQVSTMLHVSQQSGERLAASNLNASLQLNRLAIFMPAFRARVQETQLTKPLVRQIHAGLCSYIGTLDTQYMRTFQRDLHAKKSIAAHKAECEVMALLTRSGNPASFPYPALSREEASHARKQHNHDFYTLKNGRKSPVQVKTSANGSGYRNVAVIQHYDILRAFKRNPMTHHVQWDPSRDHEDFEWPNPYRYEQVLSGETLSPLTELLLEEQELGNYLPKDKKNALNLASTYVLSRML